MRRQLLSGRFSVPLKTAAQILSRQFGSLPRTMQMKLLHDPTFTKAWAARGISFLLS